MVCFTELFFATLLSVVVLLDATQVPLPYSSATFDNSLESTKSQDSSEVSAPGTYIQHYETGKGGYRLQSGFDGYIIPAMAGAVLSHATEAPVAGLATSVYNLVQPILKISGALLPKVGVVAVSLVALLLLGVAVSMFFCAHTSICHLTFLGFDVSSDTMRSFVTNDRISEVAHFVQTAIKKYQDMNDKRAVETNEVKK